MDVARRRLARVATHLCSGAGSVPASSYSRVHGAASREPTTWARVGEVDGKALEDVLYDKSPEGIARLTINRPARRNAFRCVRADAACETAPPRALRGASGDVAPRGECCNASGPMRATGGLAVVRVARGSLPKACQRGMCKFCWCSLPLFGF